MTFSRFLNFRLEVLSGEIELKKNSNRKNRKDAEKDKFKINFL